ncbi:Protein NDRG3, partial [Fragariocoptes setiger]
MLSGENENAKASASASASVGANANAIANPIANESENKKSVNNSSADNERQLSSGSGRAQVGTSTKSTATAAAAKLKQMHTQSLNDSNSSSFDSIVEQHSGGRLHHGGVGSGSGGAGSWTPVRKRAYKVITRYGDVHVVRQGIRDSGTLAPCIMTFHDLGLNSELQFGAFCDYEPVRMLLQTFTFVHVNFVGQELDAEQLGADTYGGPWTYPSVEQLAETIVDVCVQMRIRSFIGMGIGAGAYIVSLCALNRPDLVDGLFLINPCHTACTWTEWIYAKMGSLTAKAVHVGRHAHLPHALSHSNSHERERAPPEAQQDAIAQQPLNDQNQDNNHVAGDNQAEQEQQAARESHSAVKSGHHQTPIALKPVARLRQLIMSRHFVRTRAAAAHAHHHQPRHQHHNQQHQQQLHSIGSADADADADTDADADGDVGSASADADDAHQQQQHSQHSSHRHDSRTGSESDRWSEHHQHRGTDLPRLPIEYLMYHHFGPLAMIRGGGAATTSGDSHHHASSTSSRAPATGSASATAATTRRHSDTAGQSRADLGSSDDGSPVSHQSERRQRHVDDDHRDDSDTSNANMNAMTGQASASASTSSTSGGAPHDAIQDTTHDSHTPATATAQSNNSGDSHSQHSSQSTNVTRDRAHQRQQLVRAQSLYRSHFRRIERHNLCAFVHAYMRRPSLNLRKDCGVAAHAAAAVAALGTSIMCTPFIGLGAPPTAAHCSSSSSGGGGGGGGGSGAGGSHSGHSSHNILNNTDDSEPNDVNDSNNNDSSDSLASTDQCGKHHEAHARRLDSSASVGSTASAGSCGCGSTGSGGRDHSVSGTPLASAASASRSTAPATSTACRSSSADASTSASASLLSMAARHLKHQQRAHKKQHNNNNHGVDQQHARVSAGASNCNISNIGLSNIAAASPLQHPGVQVAGTKVKKVFTCQTLVMCSRVPTHCDQALSLVAKLNPLNSTWIKTDAVLVLEERPAKVCQALRLFLQGIGYSMATYERRMRLTRAFTGSSCQTTVSSGSGTHVAARSVNTHQHHNKPHHHHHHQQQQPHSTAGSATALPHAASRVPKTVTAASETVQLTRSKAPRVPLLTGSVSQLASVSSLAIDVVTGSSAPPAATLLATAAVNDDDDAAASNNFDDDNVPDLVASTTTTKTTTTSSEQQQQQCDRRDRGHTREHSSSGNI